MRWCRLGLLDSHFHINKLEQPWFLQGPGVGKIKTLPSVTEPPRSADASGSPCSIVEINFAFDFVKNSSGPVWKHHIPISISLSAELQLVKLVTQTVHFSETDLSQHLEEF